MKKHVCVDLDGVIAQYDGWKGLGVIGEPIPGAREFLSALHCHYKVVVFTTRVCVEHNREDIKKIRHFHPDTPDEILRTFLVSLVEQYMEKNSLPYDEIWSGRGKPLAIAYVDDRSVVCRPQDYKGTAKFHFDEILLRIAELAND